MSERKTSNTIRSMMVLAASGLATIAFATSTTAVKADTIFEVEHARANARAGRLVSEYDAELLDRWGALSGSYYDDQPFYYGRDRKAKARWRKRSHERR